MTKRPPPPRPMCNNEKTIYEKKRPVSHLSRRFFVKLLKNLSFHSAYLLAVDIGAKDLLNDLYYCALEHNENQIAEISRLKYHEYLIKLGFEFLTRHSIVIV